MKQEKQMLGGWELPVTTVDTVVIGSGCAGLNAADSLYDLGCRDLLLVTEGWHRGTSRNTGSDKQTYYKLSLSGDETDSVAEMARTLFAGGAVNGDTALAEAAGSVRGFMKLVNLGVPFPTTRYGEYAGYKTDHDPRRRATSAGPLTSRYMTEALEKSVRSKPIPALEHWTAIRLLERDGAVQGVLGLDATRAGEDSHGLSLIRCRRVILATGGPAGLYHASVYPESQSGMTGLALAIGAQGANLQEWQYGLASTKFRWNVSGTYQQVLPRYISVDAKGNEREFLLDYFDTPQDVLNRVFLKGYQWPFDAAKVDGSSLLDLIIYRETRVLGRRVFMDFRREPTGLEQQQFDTLSTEAYTYLKNSDAPLPTPIGRLQRMNPPAIELYAAHGIDLYNEPLEVAVCAQHHNGGLAVDSDWQTTVQGLYAVGEVAGTFGVCRPGGSALNATQVGAMRAAEHIACHPCAAPEADAAFAALAEQAVEQLKADWASAAPDARPASECWLWLQKTMSDHAAPLRSADDLEQLAKQLSALEQDFYRVTRAEDITGLVTLEKTRDMVITAHAVVSAMQTSAQQAGSRGSALVVSSDGTPVAGLPEWAYRPENPAFRQTVAVTARTPEGFTTRWQPVRPLPQEDDWFERVWQDYRERTASLHRN